MLYADRKCAYTEGFKKNVHTYTFTGPCVVTGKPYSVTVLGHELYAYRQGAKLQDAFVSLSAEDREFLLTGVSPEGWKILYSETTKMSQEEEDLYVREIDEECRSPFISEQQLNDQRNKMKEAYEAARKELM